MFWLCHASLQVLIDSILDPQCLTLDSQLSILKDKCMTHGFWAQKIRQEQMFLIYTYMFTVLLTVKHTEENKDAGGS